ncbi:MAG: hypothetical protein CW346_16205 [Bacillaceae bacterium]|nr:hypothetical protein [Bacillaceae bacterium]
MLYHRLFCFLKTFCSECADVRSLPVIIFWKRLQLHIFFFLCGLGNFIWIMPEFFCREPDERIPVFRQPGPRSGGKKPRPLFLHQRGKTAGAKLFPFVGTGSGPACETFVRFFYAV